MPTYNVEDLINSFNDLFQMDDEELENIKPIIINEISNSLTGPDCLNSIDEYIKQCDFMGYDLDQYNADLENSKTVIYETMVSLKEQYAESAIKCELIDIVYSMMESYFNMIALRLMGRDTANIGIELIHPTAKIPTYAHDGDQGADIYVPENNIIPANARGHMVHTGIKLLIPHGWAISIRPRSGMSKNTPLRISNSPATIDQQYRGEVNILFDNLSNEPYEIKAGERIAQFILEKNYKANYSQVDTVEPDTDRGEGGFGSSGN